MDPRNRVFWFRLEYVGCPCLHKAYEVVECVNFQGAGVGRRVFDSFCSLFGVTGIYRGV